MAAGYPSIRAQACQAIVHLGKPRWKHADWLGSSRFALDTSGNLYADRAYAPFGETYDEAGTNDRSFTGQTQDVIQGQTGLYDFMFRQQASSQGRWLVPDPAGLAAVDITNPQTWNRYAYVGNQPTRFTDRLGLLRTPWGVFDDGGGEGCEADGVSTPCSIVYSMLGSGAAVPCPGNDCLGITAQANGDVYRNSYSNTLTLNCNGADLSNYACGWSHWSQQFVYNADSIYQVGNPFQLGNPSGDQPVGLDIWHCAGCAAIWNNASGAANTAFVATGAVLAGVPAAGEFATSSAGDFLFARGTGALNSNNFLRIGWGWYGGNIIDFLPVGGEIFRVVLGSPSGPIHWHIWP